MCVLHLGNLQLRNLSEEEGNESVSATQVQLDLREKTKLAFLSSCALSRSPSVLAITAVDGFKSKRSIRLVNLNKATLYIFSSLHNSLEVSSIPGLSSKWSSTWQLRTEVGQSLASSGHFWRGGMRRGDAWWQRRGGKVGKKGTTPEGVDVFNPLCAQLSFSLNVAERKWKLRVGSSDQHISIVCCKSDTMWPGRKPKDVMDTWNVKINSRRDPVFSEGLGQCQNYWYLLHLRC